MTNNLMLSTNFEPSRINDYKLKSNLWTYSQKFDGIHIAITADGPRTRNGKTLPNPHLAKLLSSLPVGLQGEIAATDVSLGADAFKIATSLVMTKHISIDQTLELLNQCKYYVFNNFNNPSDSYINRLACANRALRISGNCIAEVVKLYVADLNTIYDYAQTVDGEGLIVADANAPYYFGRCNRTNPYSLKIKKLDDCESTIVGFETEVYGHNLKNVPERLWGTPKQQASKLLLFNERFGEHKVGTGFSKAEKIDIYNNFEENWLGRQATIEFMPVASNGGRPRMPRYKGLRADI